MDESKTWCPTRVYLGSSFICFIYNDFPNSVTCKATPILFADDTSIIISRPNAHLLQNDFTKIFGQITKWFQENSLSLNLCKTYLMQFCSKNKNCLDLDIAHKNGYIPNINEIKFLGLHINNILSWSSHIEKILPNYHQLVMP